MTVSKEFIKALHIFILAVINKNSKRKNVAGRYPSRGRSKA